MMMMMVVVKTTNKLCVDSQTNGLVKLHATFFHLPLTSRDNMAHCCAADVGGNGVLTAQFVYVNSTSTTINNCRVASIARSL